MTMKEMLELGAPTLPEWQYYYVHISRTTGEVYLYVYQYRKYLWDKCVFSTHDHPFAYKTPRSVESLLKDMALEYPQLLIKRQQRAELYEAAKHLQGEHK